MELCNHKLAKAAKLCFRAQTRMNSKEKWWARSDSNTRPADYESDALTN